MTNPQGNAAESTEGTNFGDGCQPEGNESLHSGGMLTVAEYALRLPTVLDGQGRALWRMKEVIKVYIHHADYATGRNAYPSYATIADATGLRVRSLPRIVKAAVEAGLLIRDGNGPGGTARYHLNLLADFETLRKPFVLAEERRSENAAERMRRYRQRAAGVRICPVTEGSRGTHLPRNTGLGVTGQMRTNHPSFDQPIKEDPSPSSAVAVAPTAGRDVIEAEIVEDSPGTELALVPDELLSTPVAAKALGIGAEKLRRLMAGQKVTPARMNGNRPLWSLPVLRAELATVEAAVPALVHELLPNLTAQWVSEWNSKTPPQSAAYHDPTLWPLPSSKRPVTEWQRALVDAWYQRMLRDCRRAPSKAETGRAVREVHALLHAGNNPNHIVAACWLAAGDPKLSIAWAMDRVNPSMFASSPSTARKTGTVLRNEHGVFEVPDGLSKGDEVDVNRMMLRTQLRPEHYEQLDRLGVRKIG